MFDKKTWEDLVEDDFEILSSESKTGILYGDECDWLEIIAKVK